VAEKEIAPEKRRRLKVSHILILFLLIGAGVFTLFQLNLKKQLKSRIEAIRAAGYPVTCEELDQWYSIPDDAENSAYVILDAIEYYNEPLEEKLLPVFGRTELPTRTETLSEESMKLISQFLGDNQKCLELLHKTADLEYSRYPADFTLGMGVLLPHLDDIRNYTFLLQLEAVHAAENEKQDMAIQSIKSIFGITNSINEEPAILSQFIRIACQERAVLSLEYAMNRMVFSDEQLIEFGRDFINSQNLSGISRAFIGERCQTLSVFENPTILNEDIVGRDIPPKPILEAYKALGLADMDAIDFLDIMDGYNKAAQLPPHLHQNAVEMVKLKRVSIPQIRILLRTFMPALGRIITLDLRNIAGLRTAQVAIAIQRYRLATGKLSDSLKDLVPDYFETVPIDPFDGKELRYSKLESGFVVYSIGEDLMDNNGTEMPKDSREQSVSKWDVTFIVER
jgi:hypothetical protein